MKGAPRSEQFDDIYFSAENGLEETAYVFLAGNNLPQAWQGRQNFTIAETGFGTGLNFLSVWKMFEETALPSQRLDFISVEKYPLSAKEIRLALSPWREFFGDKIEQMLCHYPIRLAGFHRLKINSHVTVTLIFDDVNQAFPRLHAVVDCWFLDGFTPAKNPDMWSEVVFQEMARLSVRGASYATFTAAGGVKRGLAGAGFSVDKKKGFGRKRDMISGRYQGQESATPKKALQGRRVAIIGGGLAGTSCAAVLSEYGYEPVIFEVAGELAQGASGNDTGLYNPRFTALRDAVSEFYAPAYAQFVHFLKQAKGHISHNACGALHLIDTPEKEKRFYSMIEHGGWHGDHLKILDAAHASEIAGIKIPYSCLYLPDSGSVSPREICAFNARDSKVYYNSRMQDGDFDAVLYCNAYGIKDYEDYIDFPVETVRGQITQVKSSAGLKDLQCNLHYGGYVSATQEGRNVIGATFQRWLAHENILPEDDEQNIEKLKNILPYLQKEKFTVETHRAGLRTAAKDRLPIIGRGKKPHHFVSIAHGSHGLVSSLMAAHYIADLLRGGPSCLPSDSIKALSFQRFYRKP